MTRQILTAALLGAAFLGQRPLIAADDVVMKAMRDELARSMKKLQLENLQKPYFIAYRAVETAGCGTGASFGALLNSNCEPLKDGRARSRQLSVEVRVGDYARDNTNFWAPRLAPAGVQRVLAPAGATVPVDDNYDEIRRQLWLITDSGYKNALDLFAKKKAALENRTRTDDAPDFSKETAITDAETVKPAAWNRAEAESLVKSLSLVFRQMPFIDNSEVHFAATNWNTRYVNSEGTSYTRDTASVSIRISAETQAVDGMPLTDFDVVYARSIDELPSREELTRRIRALGARMDKLRTAKVLENYTGPVLFEGQAAGEIVSQGLANALLGVPRVVVEDTRITGMFGTDGGFMSKIGSRVLPDSISIVDNPTLREFHGAALLGGYQVDEDGVKGQSTQLISTGILKTLLHSRALIPGTTASTGSHRGRGPMPSNLLLSSEKGLADAQIRSELLRVAKQRGLDYGVLIRRIGNPMLAIQSASGRIVVITANGGNQGIEIEAPLEAYKVFADGREELVRNFKITNLTLSSFKDIVAVADTPVVYTAPFRVRVNSPVIDGFLQPTGPQLVSIVTPSLLFEDLSLQRPSGEIPNLPFSKHPSFDK
jgi:hypothetical protein